MGSLFTGGYQLRQGRGGRADDDLCRLVGDQFLQWGGLDRFETTPVIAGMHQTEVLRFSDETPSGFGENRESCVGVQVGQFCHEGG